MPSMISIIIPAHNEAAVIGRLLHCLTDQTPAGQKEGRTAEEVEVIVACNGCSDSTAEIAQAFGPPVRVVRTDEASKIAALNLGDEQAVGFPRFYVDADVLLDIESVRAMAKVLGQGPPVIVSPTLEMDLSGASWPVRAYYRLWRQLPYVQSGMMGTGVYALSQTGRSRFDRFPDVIADDGYMRILFAPEEQAAVAGAKSIVAAPARLSDLIRIKTRSRLGRQELKERFPDLSARENEAKGYGQALGKLLARPTLWPAVPVYCWVVQRAKRRARQQREAGEPYRWERDESSRGEGPRGQGAQGPSV